MIKKSRFVSKTFGPVMFGIAIFLFIGVEPAPTAAQTGVAVQPAPAQAAATMPCNTAPATINLSTGVPYAGEAVGWYATGLQPSSQVSVIVTDALNPTNVYRFNDVASGWCQASGTIILPQPVPYRVELAGTSAQDQLPVRDVAAFVRAIEKEAPNAR